MRRSWTASEEECLLNHIEFHKGFNGKWTEDIGKAIEEVKSELDAIKPLGAVLLTKQNIRDKIRGIARRVRERIGRFAKPRTIFLKGPVELKVRDKLNLGTKQTHPDITAKPTQAIQVCNCLQLAGATKSSNFANRNLKYTKMSTANIVRKLQGSLNSRSSQLDQTLRPHACLCRACRPGTSPTAPEQSITHQPHAENSSPRLRQALIARLLRRDTQIVYGTLHVSALLIKQKPFRE